MTKPSSKKSRKKPTVQLYDVCETEKTSTRLSKKKKKFVKWHFILRWGFLMHYTMSQPNKQTNNKLLLVGCWRILFTILTINTNKEWEKKSGRTSRTHISTITHGCVCQINKIRAFYGNLVWERKKERNETTEWTPKSKTNISYFEWKP